MLRVLFNSFIEVKLTYKKMGVFKVYNLMKFDIWITWNFPVYAVLAVSPKLRYVMFLFLFSSKYSVISLLISTFSWQLFRSV